jgi:hypothetical protein
MHDSRPIFGLSIWRVWTQFGAEFLAESGGGKKVPCRYKMTPDFFYFIAFLACIIIQHF